MSGMAVQVVMADEDTGIMKLSYFGRITTEIKDSLFIELEEPTSRFMN